MALVATDALRMAKARVGKAAALIERMQPYINRRYDEDSVSAWINGRTVPPADALLAAAKATNLSLDEWLEDFPGVQVHEHNRRADVTHVFTTRSEFTSHMPPHNLFANARQISASGLSLNLICQQYSTASLRALLEQGCHTRCLFLAPGGSAIKAREGEENYKPGELSQLTQLNIDILQALRRSLPSSAQQRLELGTYDSTIRFNILLVDEAMGVVQPYLPAIRGIDSPTLILRHRDNDIGLFGVFTEVFNTLWKQRTAL